MEKEQLIKRIRIVVTCLIVFLFIWFFLIFPLGSFNKNENLMVEAAKRYYELNPSKLPSEGNVSTVELTKLYSKNYLDALYIPYTKKMCSVDNAWVKVKKIKGEYKYYTYLKCGILSSNVDHTGPNIILNGDDKIELDLGSSYKELGVKSVVDNTDGKMSTEKVKINSSQVNTAKVGTYKVKYYVSDSFNNQTVKIRKVVVQKTLASIINKDTKNLGFYKGVPEKNYVRFANNLFRIMRLNSDGTITLSSDSPLAYVNYDGLDDWLNDYYYGLIPTSSKKFLVDSKWCDDAIASTNNYKGCQKSHKAKISVPSAADYNNSLVDGESYLMQDIYFWLSNTKDAKQSYFVNSEKALATDKNNSFGVKPVITLKKKTTVLGGTGAQEDPYTLGDVKKAKPNAKLNTRYAGEYLVLNGNLYRVVNAEDDGATKVIGEFNVADTDDEDKILVYDNKPYIYNPNRKGNVGYKVNNELSSYFDTSYFVRHEIEVPIYKDRALYKKEVQTKKYNVKLAVPNMHEVYSTAVVESRAPSYWLINSSQNNERLNYVEVIGQYLGNVKNNLSKDGAAARVRIVGFVNPKCTIVSGEGSLEEPYIIAK